MLLKGNDMHSDIYELYRNMVKQIAAEYAKKYKMVEREDIEQQLWLWFASHPNKVTEWQSLEHQKDKDKLFAKSLRNAAFDYCRKEKAYKAGYDPADDFFYNKQFIKAMLPAVLSGDWTKLNNAMNNSSRNTKSLAESGDWLAFSSDIKIAYESLNDRERNLVFLFYAEQVDGDVLQKQVDESKSAKALMMEANRAVNRMVKFLGGLPPYKDNDFSYGEKKDDMRPMS